MAKEVTTETMDKLYLELSQFVRAKTRREIELEEEVGRLQRALWALTYEPWISTGPGLRNYVRDTIRSGVVQLDPKQLNELVVHLMEGKDG